MYYYLWLLHTFKGENRPVSRFDKNCIVGFFLDTVQARFFKLCIIITSNSYQVWWPSLCFKITCVRIVICKLFSRFVTAVQTWFWHTVCFVRLVCLRDMTRFFSILHLNVSLEHFSLLAIFMLLFFYWCKKKKGSKHFWLSMSKYNHHYVEQC